MNNVYEAPQLEPMFSISDDGRGESPQGITFTFMLLFVVGFLYVALATSTAVTDNPAE